MGTCIKDFVAGETVVGFYVLKWKDIKTSSTNKTFIDYTIQDVTGTVNAKHWGPLTDADMEYEVGAIVKIEAAITLFNGSLQAKIQRIRRARDEDDYDIADIIPVAPIPAEAMYYEIEGFISSIEHPDIRRLVAVYYDRNRERIMYYPAAKTNHHSIRSGLLYHMLRMLRTGKGICDVYTHLNRDLVYAGVLLHDLEKLNEMNANELGIVDEYTKEGQLLGHIIMGIKVIDALAKELKIDPEISLLLQHLVLTHHYEPEFGSPKKPAIPEGEVLHHLDMLDARIYDMEKATEFTEPGTFSDPVFNLERRRIYKLK
ncbi:MAG: HD domain-containing protein [Bacillota bacterium]|nr:HD domain-containing protein [Bacillota bacterium]